MIKKITQIISKFFIFTFVFLITIYRKCISPALGPRCRFYPSCSEYSSLVIQKYGIVRGLAKSCVRICKCQPFCKGGIDLP